MAEIGRALEVQALAADGMVESQFGSMQAETVGFLTVEGIAKDGRAEAFGVGAVHAQLVGAASVRDEGDEPTDHLIVGEGVLAVERVDHLARTVEGIGTQG